MHRRGVFALPLILAARGLLRANAANGDPRKERLFSMFISPCCWRENLLVHHSPKADELRAEIEGLIAAGRTDEEIKQKFLEQYSQRILSLPDGASGQWLKWTPGVAVVAGLAAVGVFIKRSLRPVASDTTRPGAKVPEFPEQEWP